ncbi:MAG: glycosyltransferase family 2 protein [Actinobacteria bacterium]|nr:glycosyltransferase family 2 protein [Actinomycetota bacterium]
MTGKTMNTQSSAQSMKDDKIFEIIAIIPAFNEEGRVGKVVEVVVNSGVADLTVVVDDGSTDKTAEEARKAGAHVIKKPVNEGKAAALETALRKYKANIYLFIDADLYGLKEDHLRKMLEPLKDKSVGMVLGRLSKGRLATNLSHFITPNITGQRAIRNELVQSLPDLSRFGFAVEVFLNDFCKKRGYKIVYVELEGVSQFLKEEKSGIFSGFIFRLKMYADILIFLVKRYFGLVKF